ncbi:diphthamide biosynthesis protein 3 [Planoprotostelium fungivorum]|uniref:Diphthamide biosynthesis protein 3 n=1 Tax=Planoprotostelium fungivorum TaxID=1890364 RepID=A0A2P6N1Y0_9EUKA|nr:diphthamide biosynthesis protein 3 [Planoprotostelium fungivorum]
MAAAVSSSAVVKVVGTEEEITVNVNDKGFYDEVEIEDLEFDEDSETFYYPCPCGDRFQVTLEELKSGEEIARCPSCSLLIRIIYSPEDLEEVEDE